MKKYVSLIILLVSLVCVIGCNAGLGPSIDLEAPTIRVEKMTSGETEIDGSNLVGLIYCKRDVSFFGIATDNKNVEKVYTEIKWSDESDFRYLAPATYKNGEWSINLQLEREGTAYVKFVATDRRNNYGTNTTKVITLGVDDTPPEGNAWYVDRKLNGIQYNLKTKEYLETVDLSLSENKDAAQNDTFEIHASFNDTMGIADNSIWISICDENGETILERKNSSSSKYSPVFDINHADLKTANLALASGKHILQIKYYAEDVVSVPESNKANGIFVDGGFFIWYPESDNPQITTKPAPDKDTKNINLKVNDNINLTLFDDDAINESYCALLTEAEYNNLNENWKENPSIIESVINKEDDYSDRYIYKKFSEERDSIINLKALSIPQKMYLVAFLNEKNGKKCTIEFPVNVVDATKPLLFISSPENNAIPNAQVSNDGAKAIMTIQGQALDTSGCKDLKFVWIPNSIATSTDKKNEIAMSILDALEQAERNKGAAKVTTKLEKDNGYVWTVQLGDIENYGNGFKKQDFEIEIDLFNDFIFNNKDESNEEKYFLVKLTRNDGQVTYQEYKLSSDKVLPKIELIDNDGHAINDMEVVPTLTDYTLRFKGVKDTIAIDTTKYRIERVDGGVVDLTTKGAYNAETGYFEYKIPQKDLEEMAKNSIKPTYKFYATDLFGNEGIAQYNLVISDLPRLTSITATSPLKCKVGDEITFSANFTGTVIVEGNAKPYLKLSGIEGIDKVEYKEGSGSTSLIFVYKVLEGHTTNGGFISVVNEVTNGKKVGPIGNSERIKSGDGNKVHLDTLDDANNLKDKKIEVDGISPVIKSVTIDANAVKENGKIYLREGKTITVEVKVSEPVHELDTPSFVLKLGDKKLEIPYNHISGNIIYFEKQIEKNDVNGELYYDSSCLTDFGYIADYTGNTLKKPSYTNTPANIVIDTEVPSKPVVCNNEDGNSLKSGNYSELEVMIDYTGTDCTVYYSLDGGSNFETYNGPFKVNNSAQITAYLEDKAGNVSEYTDMVNLEIRSEFTDFNLECKNGDDRYKAGSDIIFIVSFEDYVTISKDSTAFIDLGEGRVANLADESKGEEGTYTAKLIYKVQSEDSFSISVEKDGVNLDGITDSYEKTQGNKTLSEDYVRDGVVCDGVAPTIVSAIPNNGTKETPDYSVSGTNVYKTGNQIQIVFSEPVQKGSGNIILQQTKDWAIPPVLTTKEYNTICSKLSDDDKNKLARQENGKLLEDAVNDRITTKATNDQYYGTGQYIGPYKKSMYGLTEISGEYVPNTADVNFVLDFDIGIWETDEKHSIGITYTGGDASKEGEKITRTYASPKEETSAGEIRKVLEDAGMHKRVLDVTSANVVLETVKDESGKEKSIVTIKFPKGLIDETEELPDGREWELVFEKGTFLDYTGNEFESTVKDSRDNNGLIQINGKNHFYSDGVATPVIRVDRYSYGLQIQQPNANGELKRITADTDAPSKYVRVRIDCETKGAKVYWNSSKTSKVYEDATESYTMTADQKRDTNYSQSKITDLPSVNTNTPLYTVSPTNSYEMNESKFVVDTGDYKTACKIILVAQGMKDSLKSDIANEGIFKTVLYLSNLTNANNGEVSIRGTTNMGGEPTIAPFPLRDSAYGSPYLRRAYKSARNEYYWVSYEILLKSSFSGYYGSNWSPTWGIMYPGEFINIDNMGRYGSF